MCHRGPAGQRKAARKLQSLPVCSEAPPAGRSRKGECSPCAPVAALQAGRTSEEAMRRPVCQQRTCRMRRASNRAITLCALVAFLAREKQQGNHVAPVHQGGPTGQGEPPRKLCRPPSTGGGPATSGESARKLPLPSNPTTWNQPEATHTEMIITEVGEQPDTWVV